MSDFERDDKVLFYNAGGPNYIGTINGRYADCGWIIAFNTGAGGGAFVDADITRIPDGEPIYRNGTHVRIPADTPYSAGVCGTVYSPEFRGHLFGYWITPDDGTEPVWAPAKTLTTPPTATDGGQP